MKKTLFIVYIILVSWYVSYSQNSTDTSYTVSGITLTTKTGKIFGTLCLPKHFVKGPVALIIAGSGPTDRDCNSSMGLNTDAYKLLAHQLSKYNIATVRYDKRGIAASKSAMKSEADIRFEDYINDADDWVKLLKADSRFSKVIIIGHSEGSLIGMVTAQHNTDGYVSIAGAGQSADKIITEQLKSQPQAFRDTAAAIMDSLVHGKTIAHIPVDMQAMFRLSVQPYLISWFKYDPQIEIKKLTVPVLIIQGTNDLQVSLDEAKRLSRAEPKARVAIIRGMNHVLKNVGDDVDANNASYNNPSLPVDEELIIAIQKFINSK